MPTETEPGLLVEQGMCKKPGLQEEFAAVTAGVWPLLHLQMVDELIHFHGDILNILINAGQTQGLLSVGFVAHPRSPKSDIPGILAHTSSKSRFCSMLGH